MMNISCCDCWASGPKKESSQEYLKGTDFFLDLEGDKQLKAIKAAWNHRNTCQPGDFNHIELALPEEYLADAWNQQADEFNQWESLDPSVQLDWAQARAVAVDRNRRAALVQPGGWGPLPTNCIDSEHQGEDLELLPGQDAAPARDLLKRVGSSLAQVEPEQNGFTSEDKAARVAIREVAAWLDQRGQHGCSVWLREEADR